MQTGGRGPAVAVGTEVDFHFDRQGSCQRAQVIWISAAEKCMEVTFYTEMGRKVTQKLGYPTPTEDHQYLWKVVNSSSVPLEDHTSLGCVRRPLYMLRSNMHLSSSIRSPLSPVDEYGRTRRRSRPSRATDTRSSSRTPPPLSLNNAFGG